MGNGPSIKSPVEEFVENTPTGEGDEPPNLKQSETEILRLMFPLYYTEELLTDAELESATNCWSLILSNRAPGFVSVKKDPNCSYPTSIAYFYNVFYKRLFDINPMSRDLFKDVNTQGKFLVKMLSLSLSEKRDPEKYEQTLRKLAEVHNERGIKAIEYGLLGDVLFWALERCVGEDIYNHEMHIAWVKIYSRMLRTMVPMAVAHELRNGSAQAKRMSTYFGTYALSNSRTVSEESAAHVSSRTVE